MTTIVWDGTTLAADRMANNGCIAYAVTKIRRINGCLVGAAGDFDRINEMFQWVLDGEHPDNYPPFMRSNEDYVGMLIIRPDSSIWKYERSPYPFEIKSTTHALGSGQPFAMTAMHLGKNAEEAVDVAMALDPYSGLGVDVLRLI